MVIWLFLIVKLKGGFIFRVAKKLSNRRTALVEFFISFGWDSKVKKFYSEIILKGQLKDHVEAQRRNCAEQSEFQFKKKLEVECHRLTSSSSFFEIIKIVNLMHQIPTGWVELRRVLVMHLLVSRASSCYSTHDGAANSPRENVAIPFIH